MIEELEMDYIQVLSDCNSDSNSENDQQNRHPNLSKKYKKTLPTKTKSHTLQMFPDKEPQLESMDSNFTSFGQPNPSIEQPRKNISQNIKTQRATQSQEKQIGKGLISKIKSNPKLHIDVSA